MTRALVDTSIFIAREQNRTLGPLPDEIALSVVTLGELELGVLVAPDAGRRAQRADTLALARAADPLPVTETVMSAFSRLVYDCRSTATRIRVLDALIAATAIDHGLPVVTQDDDFDAMAAVHPSLTVLHA